MRIDLGLVSAIILEYIFFVYYANALFQRKRNKFECYAIIGVGYVLNFFICTFGNEIINTSCTFLVQTVCFKLCYNINSKNAVFQSILLTAINAAGEYIMAVILYMGAVPHDFLTITPAQSIILTIVSKTLYLFGIMIISRVLGAKRTEWNYISLGLLTVSALTVIIMFLISFNSMIFVYAMLLIINILVFAINQKMITSETEKAELKAQKLKEKIDYDEYRLLKETNRQTAILNHDFKEHINTLSALIGSDNKAAQDYIKSVYGQTEQSQFMEYSDSKILNVLLSKKKEECADKGIQFFIDPIRARLAFISDMDIVTIFSNLINNAIESCMRSDDKRIFLSIYEMNNAFTVIRLDNSADSEPVTEGGALVTSKSDKDLHGIGTVSIKQALKKYGGDIEWSYDKAEKKFTSTILINHITTVENPYRTKE